VVRQTTFVVTLLRQTSQPNLMVACHDHADWKQWFSLHGPKLLLCARQWTRSLADAEDVVQEAFVRYWRNQRHLPGDPQALLVVSVRRAALDLARREGRRAAREELADGGLEEREAHFGPVPGDDAERREQIERALADLPPEQREVLVLKIWNELTFEQIAEVLELSPNTAASRYRYGLAALRKHLSPLHHG
jgi:RNA polymerase sigma-70 factor (ECF subfamily)